MGAGKKRNRLVLARACEVTGTVRALARVCISVKVAHFNGFDGIGIGGN